VTSDRLTYHPVTEQALDNFHALVQDEHVRHYLLDGKLFSREWSEERIRESVELFGRRGVGLWLVHERETSALVGFCGFLEIPSMFPDPQLVYAMSEPFTRRGYATEMARASIAEARRHPGFEKIHASVDEENARSVHVLEKLGFLIVSTRAGHFGSVLELVLKE